MTKLIKPKPMYEQEVTMLRILQHIAYCDKELKDRYSAYKNRNGNTDIMYDQKFQQLRNIQIGRLEVLKVFDIDIKEFEWIINYQ